MSCIRLKGGHILDHNYVTDHNVHQTKMESKLLHCQEQPNKQTVKVKQWFTRTKFEKPISYSSPENYIYTLPM